jgi:hypothetical protein
MVYRGRTLAKIETELCSVHSPFYLIFFKKLLGRNPLDLHRSFLHKDTVPAVWAPDTAVFIVDLNRLLAVDASVAHQTSIAASRALCSIARFTDRETVFPIDVVGRYVPPANVCPHFLHFQIPVPMRRTDGNPHWVHLCFSCIFSSISATRFLTFLPYRTPNLPADLVFHPLVCFTI